MSISEPNALFFGGKVLIWIIKGYIMIFYGIKRGNLVLDRVTHESWWQGDLLTAKGTGLLVIKSSIIIFNQQIVDCCPLKKF